MGHILPAKAKQNCRRGRIGGWGEASVKGIFRYAGAGRRPGHLLFFTTSTFYKKRERVARKLFERWVKGPF